LIFERSREIDWKKKLDWPRFELVSQQNELKSGLFSALFTCANEATVKELHNYLNNKTSGKYHASVTSSFSQTKVSFVFCSTKDLQKIPLENWVFCICYFRKRSTNQQKQLCRDAFRVKASQSAKDWLDPAGDKNRPKMLHTPFLHESLQLDYSLLVSMFDSWLCALINYLGIEIKSE